MRYWTFLAAGLVAVAPAPLYAREVTVIVPAKAMPWSPAVNGDMAFGRQDGARPVTVFGGKLFAGSVVEFSAVGSTTTAIGGPAFGPDGQADFVTNASAGNSGAWFPSRYADAHGYPARLNQLMGAFVDGDGRVLGKPFLIGAKAKTTVPAGAMAILLGLNDDIFSDNDGRLRVIVNLPDPTVTMGGEDQ